MYISWNLNLLVFDYVEFLAFSNQDWLLLQIQEPTSHWLLSTLKHHRPNQNSPGCSWLECPIDGRNPYWELTPFSRNNIDHDLDFSYLLRLVKLMAIFHPKFLIFIWWELCIVKDQVKDLSTTADTHEVDSDKALTLSCATNVDNNQIK